MVLGVDEPSSGRALSGDVKVDKLALVRGVGTRRWRLTGRVVDGEVRTDGRKCRVDGEGSMQAEGQRGREGTVSLSRTSLGSAYRDERVGSAGAAEHGPLKDGQRHPCPHEGATGVEELGASGPRVSAWPWVRVWASDGVTGGTGSEVSTSRGRSP